MRMNSITLRELDHSRGPSCTRRAFVIDYGFDNPKRYGSVLFKDDDSTSDPLPRALRRLRMLMSIHEIPTATIKTLTTGEQEVTFEEVIHMRESLTRMLKRGGGQ